MADWYTPTQKHQALAITWTKLENTTSPIKVIKKEDLLNYYSKKERTHIERRQQYDLLFDTSKPFDPKVKKDSAKSQKEIQDSIYNEEIRRVVPVVTSHYYGHWLKDLEGRPLHTHKKVENKSDYRRTGLPLDKDVGLPKSGEFFI